jgi:hypothetical protein
MSSSSCGLTKSLAREERKNTIAARMRAAAEMIPAITAIQWYPSWPWNTREFSVGSWPIAARSGQPIRSHPGSRLLGNAAVRSIATTAETINPPMSTSSARSREPRPSRAGKALRAFQSRMPRTRPVTPSKTVRPSRTRSEVLLIVISPDCPDSK